MNKIEAVQQYLEENYADRLRWDVVSDKLEMRLEDGASTLWRELTKRDINSMVCACCAETGKNITDREVRCVLQSDFVPQVHPPRAYLNSLPTYTPIQGQTPLDYLASQVTVEGGAAEQQLWHDTFIRWFVAMVASWRDNEVVNQHVLVLIGPQGIYKTTWLERLIPPCLRPYSTKMANIRDLNKDERLRIAESVLINMDEIDSMSDRELNQMKSLITSTDVNERAAYGYNKERRIRLASFCASGNKDQFLTDTTGNRRWLPFEVESIQSPFYTTIPYNLMYAQAVWLIQHGYNYWFDMDEIAQLETHNETYRQTRNEEELLGVYFEPVDPTEPKAVFMTASEIHAKLKMWGSIDKPMPLNKFGEVLRKASYPRKKIKGIYGYVVKVIDNVQDKHTKLARELLDEVSRVSTF